MKRIQLLWFGDSTGNQNSRVLATHSRNGGQQNQLVLPTLQLFGVNAKRFTLRVAEENQFADGRNVIGFQVSDLLSVKESDFSKQCALGDRNDKTHLIGK